VNNIVAAAQAIVVEADQDDIIHASDAYVIRYELVRALRAALQQHLRGHAHCWHTLVPSDPRTYETNEGFEERCCWCGQTRTVQGVSFQAPTSEPHGQEIPQVELVRPN
jgi:hypothetical protein